MLLGLASRQEVHLDVMNSILGRLVQNVQVLDYLAHKEGTTLPL